jgi:integrase
MNGKRFGPTLGSDVRTAEIELRRLLTEIDDGRFQRPSAAKSKAIKSKAPERLTFLDLCDRHVTDVRKLKGKETPNTYRGRLMHAIRFAEQPDSRRQWPYAQDIDRDFAIGLRENLFTVVTTRNGKPGATPIPLSNSQMHNIMECVRTTLHWAARPDIRLLPFDFINPFTKEIVGDRPRKDPLRKQILPLDLRVALIKNLDCWQLPTIGLAALLPFRPEDLEAILISDIDFSAKTLRLGTRFQGADFNKGKVDYQMPLPAELMPVLTACAGDRIEGPLLLRRSIWNRSRFPKLDSIDRDEFPALLRERLISEGARTSSANDRKEITRGLLRDLGAVDTDQLGKEFKRQLARSTGVNTNLYQLRHAVSTDMSRAGIRHLELRYLTGHSTDDIMNEYVSLDPKGEMQKYYNFAKPLLEAIEKRGAELGCFDPALYIDRTAEVIEVFVSV